MEFLALIIWLLLAGAGAAMLPAAFTAPIAAIAALAAITGLPICILWIVLDAPSWTGWVQVGCAAVGILAGGFAAAQLVDGDVISGTAAEELGAAALGVSLPIFGVVLFVTLCMAIGATDPVV
jgi:hypothetical protein